MKRKSGTQRANEFTKKSFIQKKFGDIQLSGGDLLKLEQFFNEYLKENSGEVTDSVYGTIGNLIVHRPEVSDLYAQFKKLRSLPCGSLEHFVELYGEVEGIARYTEKSNNISEKNSLSNEQKVSAFLNKKCVSSLVNKETLTTTQLLELEKLLLSREYSEFHDNESIIVDLLLNFESNFIERFNTVKHAPITSYRYYQARYGKNAEQKFKDYQNSKVLNAKTHFQNCREYWVARGYSESESIENAINVQKTRAAAAAKALTNKPSPRNIEFWRNKGYSEIESADIVRKIQTRDLEFFITKYGEELGHYKFQEVIQKRITTWFARTDGDRADINKTKGRTYEQLVIQYGEDAANDIMVRRLESNPLISKESKTFFKELDTILPSSISSQSITGYKTPERWVKVDDNFYFLDYYVNGCIIEYHGSYWHADPKLFASDDWHSALKSSASEVWSKDKTRIDNLIKLGYNTLIIWSSDVADDRTLQLKKCKEFLLEHCDISTSN